MAHSGQKRSAPRGRLPAVESNRLYDRHAQELSVLLGWFFLRHLNRLYQTFHGDLLLAIVLGEIAQHNICHHFSSGRPKTSNPGGNWMIPEVWGALEPCNPFSLSAATGIPRETCRRKIVVLQKQGLVAKHPKGGYVIAPRISERFRDPNRETFANVLELIRHLQEILAAPDRPGGR